MVFYGVQWNSLHLPIRNDVLPKMKGHGKYPNVQPSVRTVGSERVCIWKSGGLSSAHHDASTRHLLHRTAHSLHLREYSHYPSSAAMMQEYCCCKMFWMILIDLVDLIWSSLIYRWLADIMFLQNSAYFCRYSRYLFLAVNILNIYSWPWIFSVFNPWDSFAASWSRQKH